MLFHVIVHTIPKFNWASIKPNNIRKSVYYAHITLWTLQFSVKYSVFVYTFPVRRNSWWMSHINYPWIFASCSEGLSVFSQWTDRWVCASLCRSLPFANSFVGLGPFSGTSWFSGCPCVCPTSQPAFPCSGTRTGTFRC